MNHDNRTDQAGSHSPGCLIYILKFIILIGKLNSECLGKAITKIVGGSGLQRLTVMHQRLDGVGCLSAREFLLLSLAPPDNRHCQKVLTEIGIQIQHLDSSLLCLLRCRMSRVSLLP